MRKILVALCAIGLALAVPTIPARAQFTGPIYCNQSALNTAITTATTTSLIPVPAGSSTSRLFICGFNLLGNSGASAMTAQLEYGTGAACTNPTVITGVLPVAAGALVGDASAFWRGLIVPSGNGLCVVTAGTTVALTAQVFYAQQ